MFNIYDTLVLPAHGGSGHVPHLAQSWSSDGNVFTFNLRTDVTFQSGNPMTAVDVVYSLDRIKALGAGLSYLFNIVESAEAVDTYSVKFTLSSPYAPFIASLVRLPIVDRVLIDANKGDSVWGEEFVSGNAAGSGAYTVTSHNPQEETVMAKNGRYFPGVTDKAPDVVRLRY